MGRDFTPLQQHLADNYIHDIKGEYLHNMHITWHIEGQKDMKMWNDEARKQYPNLCFLLSGFETNEYEKIKDDELKLSCYAFAESILSKMVGDIDNQLKTQEGVNTPIFEFAKESIEYELCEKIYKWYMGKLDEHFYYHEDNTELMYLAMNDYISIKRDMLSLDRYDEIRE